MSAKTSTQVTTSSVIPAFEATELSTISTTCEKVRATFRSNKTKDLEWRKVQLRKLYWAMEDFKDLILQALDQDFRKCQFESLLTEINWVKSDCLFMIKHLDSFAADEPAPYVPLAFSVQKLRYRKEPLGAVLIIGAYNYPVQLVLGPLVGAISAGCTAVIKPSESAPAVAMVLKEMIETRLDPSAYGVVNGMVPETTALLDQYWGKIFYTGSNTVGKIIAVKAAEKLTPVTLELGGRNPAFITRHSNLRLAAKRLLWGKAMNAGQICVSHNYCLVERTVVDGFIAELNRAHNEFFPKGARHSDNLCRIINDRQFDRMKRMLDGTKGKIVMGGQMDRSELFMEPTAVLVNSKDDAMVVEESFGPIFSVLPYDTLDEAIEIANQVDPTPLALFAFGTDAEAEKILGSVNSGGASVNDSFAHGSVGTVSFGGVGTSGMGSYRGKFSFDTFTHLRTVAKTPDWMEKLLDARYMPYNLKDLKLMAMLTAGRPNFDREGKVVKGFSYWLRLIFGLGGGKGAFSRMLLIVVAGYVGLYGLTLPQQILPLLNAMRR